MSILIGAIADDFTGASDLANTLVGKGVRVVQLIGVPEAGLHLGDADAVVVALKSRTSAVNDAVSQSLATFEWLKAQGVRQTIFKYCSTFDSTPQGNIGPVADALMAALGQSLAVICPAFPQNGRTIYKGHLFVGDLPLSESSMKDHPLTPMHDSSLIRLMEMQSTGSVGLISLETVHAGVEAVRARMRRLVESGHRYAVADALSEQDLHTVGAALADHALVTGGSGIAVGLPDNFRSSGALRPATKPEAPRAKGRAIIIAGSCSTATRGQIARAQKKWPSFAIDVDRIALGHDEAEAAIAWAVNQSPAEPVIVYASADAGEVAATQEKYGRARASQMVEDTLAKIAKRAQALGFGRFIVAGGETSGAVVTALGITALRIGPEIAPGVPWTEALGRPPLAIALKSGNFGAATFFEDALDMLP